MRISEQLNHIYKVALALLFSALIFFINLYHSDLRSNNTETHKAILTMEVRQRDFSKQWDSFMNSREDIVRKVYIAEQYMVVQAEGENIALQRAE